MCEKIVSYFAAQKIKGLSLYKLKELIENDSVLKKSEKSLSLIDKNNDPIYLGCIDDHFSNSKNTKPKIKTCYHIQKNLGISYKSNEISTCFSIEEPNIDLFDTVYFSECKNCFETAINNFYIGRLNLKNVKSKSKKIRK